MKKVFFLAMMCLMALSMMAQTTELTGVTLQSWSQPMTFTFDNSSPWTVSSGNQIFSPKLYKDQSSTLTMTVNPTVKSTVNLNFWHGDATDQNNQNKLFLDVYLDEELVRTISPSVGYHLNPTYFFDVEAGEHVFKFVARQTRTDASWNQFRIIPNGMIATDHVVEAAVTEPGSLGTEVLYDPEIDVLADVRCLRVTGQLNDADWTTLRNMSTTLWKLDLSGVTNTIIPNGQFRRDGATWQFLHEVALPSNLTKIEDNAFYYSLITDITFPESIDIIGHDAFHKAQLDAVTLPANYCTTPRDGIAGYTFNTVFMDCQAMKSFSFADPDKMVLLGENYMRGCISLTGFNLPSNVYEVQPRACEDCWNNDFGSLSSLKNIGREGFCRTANTNIDLANLEWMERSAIDGNRFLESVTIGEKFYKFDNSGDFVACQNLRTFKLKSPTVCVYNGCFTDSYRAGMTLQVPNYLVNNYKVDANWMTIGTIEGFATDEIDIFHINQNLTLGARQRMEGNPSLYIPTNILFKIAGESQQNFNKVTVHSNYYDNQFTQIISTCPNVNVTLGKLNIFGGLTSRGYQQWFMLALPYDICVDDITPQSGSFAIRYYDGNARALNGVVSGNKSWKDFQPGDIIPAGKGFTFTASQRTWTAFPSTGNGDGLFSTQAVSVPLEQHLSATPANQSWNLVGNPYQCYYDAKMMNFNAPITVYSVSSWGEQSYTAYSLLDDNYILRPNEGFFVQAPEGIDHITFALEGKQTVSTPIARSNARMAAANTNRFLVDLTINGMENSDRTRVVMNDEASYDYEMICDASKMFGEGLQVYTIGAENLAYAINERPQGDGFVNLGVMIPADGTYTFALTRNNANRVILFDNETGAQTDLTSGDYTFTALKGTHNGRFSVLIESELTTVQAVPSCIAKPVETFDLFGRRINGNANTVKGGIYVVNGRKVTAK